MFLECHRQMGPGSLDDDVKDGSELYRELAARIEGYRLARLIKAAPSTLFVAQSKTGQIFMVQRGVMIQERRIGFAGDGIRHVDCSQRRETRFCSLVWVMVVGHSVK